MAEDNNSPQDLVDEFKRSGEFDRLRNAILEKLLSSRGGEAFQRRVNEVAIENLARADDSLLERKHTDRLLGSIRSDLDRYPIIERLMRNFNDLLQEEEDSTQSIQESLQRLEDPYVELEESRMSNGADAESSDAGMDLENDRHAKMELEDEDS